MAPRPQHYSLATANDEPLSGTNSLSSHLIKDSLNAIAF